MRQIFFFAFALLLASAAYAASDSQAPEAGALSRLVSPAAGSKPFAVPYESVEGGNYHYLISFDGGEQFFARLWVENNTTYGQLVSGNQELKKLVSDYDAKRGASSGIPSSLASATSRMSNYTSQFVPSQKECRRLMGLRDRNCTSYDTCMKACYAITSFCLEIAQQFGKPFIYDLWQYENDTRDLLSLSSSERLLAKELSTSPSVAGMNSYATVLDKMDVISTRMVSNNIFVKERYCDPPPLSLSTIRDARLDVSKALSFSNAISGIDARAAQFSENAKKYSKNQTITNLALPLATQDKTAANSTPEIIANESKSGIAIPQIPKPDSAIVLLPLGAFCGSIAIAGLVAAVFYFKQKGRL